MNLDTEIKKWFYDVITNLIDMGVDTEDSDSPITWDRAMKLYNKGLEPERASQALLQLSERYNKLSEEFKLKDITSRVVKDKEMIDFIKQIKQNYVSTGGRSGGGSTEWKDQKKMGAFDPKDKSKRRDPYFHSSTARKIDKTSKAYGGKSVGKDEVDITWEDTGKEYEGIVSDSGKEFDLDELRKMITTRPSNILGKNEKMEKTGKEVEVYTIGLPALTGLVVDEDTGDFHVINTCPSAGACRIHCYAMKGNYIRYSNKNEKMTKLLNWLVNDPTGFANKIKSEVNTKKRTAQRAGKEVVIRWHDAGDFFSADYADLAIQLAKDVPDVLWYGYTKVGDVATRDFPDNFIMNFSVESKDAKNVDLDKQKFSVVVPPEVFDEHVVPYKDEKGKTKYKYKSKEDLAELKYKLATKYFKYGVKEENIITYGQMEKMKEGEPLKYHVIVLPSTDGDVGAFRKDVQISFLLHH